MALYLGLSAPFTSLLLRKKRHLDLRRIDVIADKIFLRAKEKEFFRLLHLFETTRSNELKIYAETKIYALKSKSTALTDIDVFPISEDKAAIIAEWQFAVILAFLSDQTEQTSAQKISRAVKLELPDVEARLYTLLRVGLVRLVKKGWMPSNKYFEIKEIPSKAIRSYHKQILKKAMIAIDEQRLLEKEFSSMVFTVDSNKIAMIKNEIRSFQKRILQISENGKNKKIYYMCIQFFKN